MNKSITDYVLTFGKYKGQTLDDVPADYLLWLEEQDWVQEKFPKIVAYVMKNRKAIEMEVKEKNV